MTDWLEDAWKEGVGGDAIKTSELVNRCFTILRVTLKDVEDDKAPGGIRRTYVGMIRFDNETEDVEAWLGGSGVKSQIDAIMQDVRLPMRVKLILEGKAYKLVIPSDGAAQHTPEPIGLPSLTSLLTAWVKEVGGMGAVADALQAKTLMAPIANALAYDGEGKLVWKLTGLSVQDESELRTALAGKWQPADVAAEDIPFA